MARSNGLPILFAALALSLTTAIPLATPATAQDAPEVYGSQIMTQQERFEHRQRMLNATTAEERERIRADHHRAMQERAKEMGVTLPKEPPAQGLGKGRGQGKGQGLGTGAGQGRGKGKGGG